MNAISTIPTFELSGKGTQARARVEGNYFVVLAGSLARFAESASFKNHPYSPLRKTLLDEGKLVPDTDSESLIFTQDTPFTSPSAAAAVTLGRAANGKTAWHVAQGEHSAGVHFGTWLEGSSIPLAPSLKAEDLQSLVSVWQPFFQELTTTLLNYENRQPQLVQVLRNAGVRLQFEQGDDLLDPFSFFSLLLKHRSSSRLTELMTSVAEQLGLTEEVPAEFTGVPWSNPMSSWFFAFHSERQPEDVPTLWQLAREAAVGELEGETFTAALNIRIVALAKLTQGLFWLNPQTFFALNSINVAYLKRSGVAGAGNVETLEAYKEILEAARPLAPDFPTLSHLAWLAAQKGKDPARMEGDAFPFDDFRKEADSFGGDVPKANMLLDRRYAPLLISLVEEVEETKLIHPERQPYSSGQYVGVKIGLGKHKDSGRTSQAFLFPMDALEVLALPAGLTLRVSLNEVQPELLGSALKDESLCERLAQEIASTGDQFSTFTLVSDTLPLTSYAVKPEKLPRVRRDLTGDLGKNVHLIVDYTLTPDLLQSEAFPEAFAMGLAYINQVTAILDEVTKVAEARSRIEDEAERTVQPIGLSETEVISKTKVPQLPSGVPLNQILYGPPGTGKTYQVVEEALRVLDPAFLSNHLGPAERTARKTRYDALVADEHVSFVTFHQSFGYEDFIEGIKPIFEGGALRYELEDGLFLQAVKATGSKLEGASAKRTPEEIRALPDGLKPDGQVWRIYIDGTVPVSQVRERSVARGEIRIGSFTSKFGQVEAKTADLTDLQADQIHPYQLLFRDSMRVGDLILLATGTNKIGAVGVVTGDYRFDLHSDSLFTPNYGHARPVRWLAKGLELSAQQVTGKTFAPPTLQRVTGVTPEQVLHLLPSEAKVAPSLRPHVLIIDEINRGNVAKIFGELITLLEPGKRAGESEALTVTLPLSKRKLTVPRSLYIVGTMNTADRSLSQLDAALRRRFVFRPVWPQPEVLPVVEIDGVALDLRKFLYAINRRIEHLLSREQVIGHAYLLGVPQTLEGIAAALRERILPLLEEYFFEDWAHIREVLGDNRKPNALQFIREEQRSAGVWYVRNPSAFEDIEAFVRVYNSMNDTDFPFA